MGDGDFDPDKVIASRRASLPLRPGGKFTRHAGFVSSPTLPADELDPSLRQARSEPPRSPTGMPTQARVWSRGTPSPLGRHQLPGGAKTRLQPRRPPPTAVTSPRANTPKDRTKPEVSRPPAVSEAPAIISWGKQSKLVVGLAEEGVGVDEIARRLNTSQRQVIAHLRLAGLRREDNSEEGQLF